MFRSNKYTRQVLFACLFTVCFFVGYAALATVMRLWLVPAGFVACTAFAAALLATIPVIILFMCIEKHLAEGLTSGGVKG